jgi:MoxR-like ATPase
VIIMRSADAAARIFAQQFDMLAAAIDSFVIGKPDAVRLALTCLFAEGHLLVEDVPGVAKTSLAKAIGNSISGGIVKRIQFTPDLLPADVLGVPVYDQAIRDFRFRKGPVFGNIVLADEINRAAPKAQSALLEVMAEGQVTVDGEAYPAEWPFMCIATQNPAGYHGTYPLPEAQVDRFMMAITMGYPAHEAEMRVVAQGVSRRRPEDLPPVISLSEIREMIQVTRAVYVSEAIADYVVTLVTRTRSAPEIQLGPSPRASVALAQASQAHAASQGRGSVHESDVQAVMLPVLRHRLILTPDAELNGTSVAGLLSKIRGKVAVPTAYAR